MTEIERKFLVKSDAFKSDAYQKTRIVQGFLNTHPERTVRIRINGQQAFLTVKGKSSENGLSRFEWEKEIEVKEAEDLLKLCEQGIIEKDRYLVEIENHIFEVDEFHGQNEGLIIAEIELNAEEDTFSKPFWLGEEVTGDIRYYNSQLSKKPYLNW
ncbi:MAG: CYTH domain-containing protein [Bacteroidota bacterium]